MDHSNQEALDLDKMLNFVEVNEKALEYNTRAEQFSSRQYQIEKNSQDSLGQNESSIQEFESQLEQMLLETSTASVLERKSALEVEKIHECPSVD